MVARSQAWRITSSPGHYFSRRWPRPVRRPRPLTAKEAPAPGLVSQALDYGLSVGQEGLLSRRSGLLDVSGPSSCLRGVETADMPCSGRW